MFTRLDGVRSRWRSVALLFVGITLGATLGSPVAARVTGTGNAPATTSTRSTSCHGYDFEPLVSGTTFNYYGTVRFTSDSNGAWFVCNPSLPTGAVVTKVQFTLLDNWVGRDVHLCDLVRSPLAAAGAESYQVLGSVPSTGLDATPHDVRLTDATIQNATIDNAGFAYWLQCYLDNGIGFSTTVPVIGIYGADVIYTITAAKG